MEEPCVEEPSSSEPPPEVLRVAEPLRPPVSLPAGAEAVWLVPADDTGVAAAASGAGPSKVVVGALALATSVAGAGADAVWTVLPGGDAASPAALGVGPGRVVVVPPAPVTSAVAGVVPASGVGEVADRVEVVVWVPPPAGVSLGAPPLAGVVSAGSAVAAGVALATWGVVTAVVAAVF